MIQAVISRLGTDAFVIKGWAVTVAGAFFGFTFSTSDWRLSVVSVIPTVLFWVLDAYFLRSERAFRQLYDSVRLGELNDPLFMSATSPAFLKLLPAKRRKELSWSKTFIRPTLLALYLALMLSAAVIASIVANWLKAPACPS